MNRKLLTLLIGLFASFAVLAQTATTFKALRPTTTASDTSSLKASATEGFFFWNPIFKHYQIYKGGIWLHFGEGSGTGLSTSLSPGHLYVGNGSSVATDVAMTGDASLSSAGAITVNNIKGNTVPSNASGALTNNGSGTLTWTPYLLPSNNLSDLASATTARTNLGLGTAATQNSSAFLQPSNNLSDVSSSSTARTNLGLGTAATHPTSDFLQSANNLSDLGSASTARTNMGLGTLATQNGTFSGTSSGTNTGDQTITLSGAITGSGTGAITTTFATPGTLSVSSSNSNANTHTHAITSSSAPGATASILATDASGIIGSTGSRIVKAWFIDLTVTNSIAGSVTGNAGTATALATPRTIGTITGDATSAGSSFDGSANNTNALTLATVNGNVGAFGSATQSLTLTANAKGLITAVSAQTVTPAIGSITGLGTGIATALGINTGSAGAPVLFNGAGGTPTSLTGTNITGIPLTSGVTGILPIANGGTNNGSLSVTQGVIYYGDGSKITSLATGTSGQVLQTQGAGANPQWANATGTYIYNITSSSTNPANNNNYFINDFARAWQNGTGGSGYTYIRRACTIKIAELFWLNGGTNATGENISVYIRVNNTTDYLIATVGNTSVSKTFTNTGLSISLSAGDYFEIKVSTPTWSTTPTACFLSGYILVDY